MEFLLADRRITGAVNVVGPHPDTNAEFTRVLAGLLHRPGVLQAPALGLKVLLGEFSHETLVSQRVLPKVLTEAGFTYRNPALESALRAALGLPAA